MFGNFFRKDNSVFQSALPRGERPLVNLLPVGVLDFNPRSHEGSDYDGDGRSAEYSDFNPRSHEGSDLSGV